MGQQRLVAGNFAGVDSGDVSTVETLNLVSAIGLAVLMAFILRDVRVRYVESMRRTLNDTAAVLATLAEPAPGAATDGSDLGAAWREKLPSLSRAAGNLRVYVTDARGIVVFDGNGGKDVGRDYTLRPEMQEYFSKAYETTGNEGLVDGELRVTAPVIHGGKTGNVYVTINGRRIVVLKCGAEEELVREIKGNGCPAGEFGANPSIAIDQSNGHIVEFANNQEGEAAREYDSAGACVKQDGFAGLDAVQAP